MSCKDCKNKGQCPVNAEPQNVIMGKACDALRKHCKKGNCPENPMDWIRKWIRLNDKRERPEFAEADPDKIIVSMLEFKGNIYVATQKGIYILKEDKFIRLQLTEKKLEDV